MTKDQFIDIARKLFPSYQPSNSITQKLQKLELVAVVGPTGVGKSTLIQGSQIPFIKTDVTREPRADEQEGVDFNFRTDLDNLHAELNNQQFVQYIVLPTNEFYGTKIESYPDKGLCTMPIVTAAINNFRSLGFGKVTVIYVLPPNYDEWIRRIKNHEDSGLINEARMVEARRSLNDALNEPSYIFLINDDLPRATAEFIKLSKGEKHDDSLEDKGRKIARELLNRLG